MKKGGRAVRRSGGSLGSNDPETTALPPYRPAARPFRALPVEFIGSFPDPRVSLDPALPEIAFVGRSNVGKSSLLNALTGRPGLARVSGTPGKTAHVNVFRFPAFYLVDLPGYGFARASREVRVAYRRLVEGYLTKRERLMGVVWLLDSRHQPSKEDFEMQELLAVSGRNVLPVLTKADKLGREAQRTRTQEIAAAIGVDPSDAILVSSETGLGLADLGESILAVIGGEA